MKNSTRASLERRIAAAEKAVQKRWIDRAVAALADEINAAPDMVGNAIASRLRRLPRLQAADPAWHTDTVVAILRATAEIDPDMAQRVATKLGIEKEEY